MPRAAQERARAVRRWIGDQGRGFQPAGELGEGDLRPGPGQGSAEAVVDTAAEAEVLVVLPVGVEPVGVGYVAGVPAARGQDEGDRCAAGDGGAGDVDVVEGDAVLEELHRWFVAQ